MESENVLTLTTNDFALTIPRQKFVVILFHNPDRTFSLDFVYEFIRAAKLLAKHDHHQTTAALIPAPVVKINLGVVDVVVFAHFFGDEYDNFLEVAETFNWDFDFYRNNTHEDPHVVNLFNYLKDNERYEDTQAMLFINLFGVHGHDFESRYYQLANKYNDISFMLGESENRKEALLNVSIHLFYPTSIVLLELYRSTGGEFEERADILNHVATHFIHNADVLIAKLDETRNDIRNENPGDLRTREGGPTLNLITPEENIKVYSEEFTKEGIINFITTI
ncbi:hypothetical protein ACFE04_000171 [Oxalis oulophora]